MKRKLFAGLLVLCLAAACVLPVFAAGSKLADNADLLSAEEARRVEQLLEEVSSRHGMDILVVTTVTLNGKPVMAYADDYYDYNGCAKDGILLLVSTEDRDWHISTAGYGITAITDAGREYISDRIVPYLSNGDYAQAFTVFAQLCDEFIAQARTGEPYDSHNLPKEPFRLVPSLIISLVIGIVVALIATGTMKKQLKTVCQQVKADSYVTPGSMQLTVSRDLFLYTSLDRREKPKQSGGSSTHTSSSGTTHGGGGGKF